jgi:hypothetical protein
MKIEKKIITIRLTAGEAEWLYDQLEKIRREHGQGGAAPSALKESFRAASLQDRIQSEGT